MYSRKREAPMLENFFTELSQGAAVNYCALCLRTQKEIKLVSNKALRNFSNAMKMNKIWKHYLICYMCERQAVKALNFFKAATFAAAVDTIFAELMYQRNNKKVDVFQKNTFKNILEKFGLGGGMTSPAEWEAQLNVIRKSTKFNETETMVVDSKKDNYVTSGQMTATTVHSRMTIYPDAATVTTRPPDRPAYCRRQYGGHTGRFGGHADLAVGSVSNDSLMLSSTHPNVSETLVILDDEEDMPLIIEKVESTAPKPIPVPTQSSPSILQNVLQNNNIPQLNPNPTPRLVPLENLLEPPKDVFPGDGFLVTHTTGKLLLQPITMANGVTILPSVDANIFDSCLIRQPLPIVYPIDNIEVNKTLEDVVQRPEEDSPVFNGDGDEEIGEPDVLAGKRCSTDYDMELTTPSKRSKVLPVSAPPPAPVLKKNVKIDWEDKIPMDVISYMGALDPNRHQLMSPHIAKPTAAPRKPPERRVQQTIHEYTNDIIDLC